MEVVENHACHLLMIDDDENLCELISDYLCAYGVTMECAMDGNTGLQGALSGRFDAVLLDIMLPDIDGLTILKRIRAKDPKLPVVIISAQTDVSDRIVGLEMGADDYVPKTFSPRELLARVRAVIRRSAPEAETSAAIVPPACGDVVSVHGLTLDKPRMQAVLDGDPLDLSTNEFRLLYLMASQPGRVFTRDQLMEELAGSEYYALGRSIDMYISSLRRKLGDSPRSPSYLRTVRGSGYMFMK